MRGGCPPIERPSPSGTLQPDEKALCKKDPNRRPWMRDSLFKEGVPPRSQGPFRRGEGRKSRCSRTIDRTESNKKTPIESMLDAPGVQNEAKTSFLNDFCLVTLLNLGSPKKSSAPGASQKLSIGAFFSSRRDLSF